jgi:hypothetical protein
MTVISLLFSFGLACSANRVKEPNSSEVRNHVSIAEVRPEASPSQRQVPSSAANDAGISAGGPADSQVTNEKRAVAGAARDNPSTANTPEPAKSQPEPAEVKCHSTWDCWVEGDHPVKRPKGVKRAYQGCHDGDYLPKCVDGRCIVGGLLGC